MRSSAAFVDSSPPASSGHSSLNEAIRVLVDLTDDANVSKTTGDSERNSAEEILIDAEVDGARYLLIRMPKSNRSRIQLSPREQEIVRMVAKGHPNKVIADVLNISSWTVCTHLRRIFAKLGVGSRAAMVAQLLELGVLANEPRISSVPQSKPGLIKNLA
jgi:DNA-binding CsgD family transcriptional regulator